eukprot:jgi/Ulvmu1/2575/UM014_0026.1
MDRVYGDHEISSVLQAAQAGARLDGRSFDDIMNVELTTGVITQASGSVELRMGETHVLAGVKADIESPSDLYPDEGIVNIAVHPSPFKQTQEDGRRLEEHGTALAAVLQRLLLSRTRAGAALDLGSLCIIPGTAVWQLSVDCVVFAAGGGLVDALALAVRAALAAAAVPAVKVDDGIEDATAEDIEVDPDAAAVLRLDVSNLPIVVTACQLGPQVCLGSTKVEEEAADSFTHVAVNRKGQVCGLVKGGRAMMGFVELQNMIVAAQHAGPSIIASLETLPSEL